MRGEPEIVFRIVHVAFEGDLTADTTPSLQYCEQVIDVGLGPDPTFATNGVGMLRRTVSYDEIITAVPASRRKRHKRPKPKSPGLPPVVQTLQKAAEWRRQLDAGEIPNQAAIAMREGITRARVTQILGLLRLAPSIRESIVALPATCHGASVSERMLRRIVKMNDPEEQVHAFVTRSGNSDVL